MKTIEQLSVKGTLLIFINNKLVRRIDNLVVTDGKDWIVSRMQGVVDGVVTHMAIGEGTTAAAIGDSTLETEVARVAVDTSGGVASGNTLTFTCTFAADVPDVTDPATAPITEAGLLNAASLGILVARTVFPVINKGEADTMTINWVITIS